MVYALLNISEHTNRLLNVVKAKYGLKTKAQAIEKMAMEYESEVLEPNLRPEFVEEAQERLKSGKFTKVRKVSDLFR